MFKPIRKILDEMKELLDIQDEKIRLSNERIAKVVDLPKSEERTQKVVEKYSTPTRRNYVLWEEMNSDLSSSDEEDSPKTRCRKKKKTPRYNNEFYFQVSNLHPDSYRLSIPYEYIDVNKVQLKSIIDNLDEILKRLQTGRI